MSNLILSPNGTISSPQMIKGGLILIAVGMLLNLGPMIGLSQGMNQLLLWLGFLLIVPWIFLWMKRYRDGGQHPAMSLIPIILFPILCVVLLLVLNWGMFSAAISAAMEFPGDQAAANQAATEAVTAAMARKMQMTSFLVPLLASLALLFGFNALIKHRPQPET